MAAEDLRIIIKASDEASAVLKGIGKEASGLGGIMGGVLKAGLLGAAAGITALGAGLVASIVEAVDSEEAMAKLAAVLESTGGISGVTMQQALGLASAFQRVTRFSDETVMSAEAVLLRFRSISKDVFPEATKVTLDLATALGVDASSAATMLGKALETPGEGLLRLKQAGVAFDDEQTKMILKMAEAGNMAGAQALILKELEKSIGGAANAAGNTFAGQLDILKNAFSDSLEIIGGAFLPGLTSLVTSINANVMPAFREWANLIAQGEWGTAIRQAWTKITEMATAIINELIKQWPNISAQFEVWAAHTWDWLTGTVIPGIATQVGALITGIATFLKDHWIDISTALGTWGGQFWDWLTDPTSGAIVKTAESMGEITTSMREWTENPTNKQSLRDIGKTISSTLIAGIQAENGDVSRQAETGVTIFDHLNKAITNIQKSIGGAGADVSIGLVEGLNLDLSSTQEQALTGGALQGLITAFITDTMGWTKGATGKQLTDDLGAAIIGDIGDAFAAKQSEMGTKLETTIQGAADAVKLLMPASTSLLATGKAALDRLISGMGDKQTDTETKITGVIQNAADVVKLLMPANTNLFDLGKAAMGRVVDGVGDKQTDLKNKIASVFSDAAYKVWLDITNVGTDISQGFAAMGQSAMGRVIIGVGGKLTDLQNALTKTVSDAAYNVATSIYNGVSTAIANLADLGYQVAYQVGKGIGDAFKTIGEWIKYAFGQAIDWAKWLLGWGPRPSGATVGAMMSEGVGIAMGGFSLGAGAGGASLLGGGSPAIAGAGVGGVTVNFYYSPDISLATREEAQNTIAPMVVTAVLDAQRRGMLAA